MEANAWKKAWEKAWGNAQEESKITTVEGITANDGGATTDAWKKAWDAVKKERFSSSSRDEQEIRDWTNYVIQRSVLSSSEGRETLIENLTQKELEKAQKEAQEKAQQQKIQENRDSMANLFKDMGLDDDTIIFLNKITGGEPTGLDESKWYNRLINNALYAVNRFSTEGGNAIGSIALLPERVIDPVARLSKSEPTNTTESEDIKMLAEYDASGGETSTFEAARSGIREKYGVTILRSAYNQYLLNKGISARESDMNENLVSSKAGEIVGNISGAIGGMIPGIMLGSAIDGMTGEGATASKGGAITGVVSDIKNGVAAKQVTKNALSRLFQYNTTNLINASVAASQAYTEWSKTYGDKPVQTFFNALGTGLAEYLTENMFGAPTDAAKLGQYYKPDATSSFIKNVAKEWKSLLGEMAEEGAEEIINAPLQGLVNKATGEYDKSWFGWGNGAVFDFKEMLDSGLTGAAAGGIMGFVYSSANAISQAQDVRSKAKAFNKYIDKLPEEIRPEHIDVKSAKTTADVVEQATGNLYKMLAEICRIKGIQVQVAENGQLVFRMSGQNNATVQDIANDPAIQQIIQSINDITGHDKTIIYSDEYVDISDQVTDSTEVADDVSGADIATGNAEDVRVPSAEELRERQDNAGSEPVVSSEERVPAANDRDTKAAASSQSSGLTRGADIDMVSEQAMKYGKTGATFEETIDELVRSGLVTDVNALTQVEGMSIANAWNQGNLDYKDAQKKKAGEVSVRGNSEGAEVTGQDMSGEIVPTNARASIVQNAENANATVENADAELQSGEDSGTINHDVAVLDSYGVSDEGKRAFLQYKSSESYVINEKLRNGLELSEDDVQLVHGMDETLEKLPIYSGKTYREIDFYYDDDLQDFLSKTSEGNPTKFAAYTSSAKTKGAYTLDQSKIDERDRPKYIVKMELESKSGRDASNLGITKEREVIFPRNTRFFVERVARTGNVINIKATEVASNEKQSRARGKKSVQNEPGSDSPAVRGVSKLPQNDKAGVADVRGVSGRDTGRDSGRVSRSHGGVSGGQRSEVRPGRSRTSESGTVQGVAEVLKPSVETAKRKLARGLNSDVKMLGKTAKAIYDRITGEGLSFSDVTLGKPPAGFNAAQQEQIVRALLNADESDGKSTRVDLIGDGTFTFSNDSVKTSDMLARLGVKLSVGADVAIRADIGKAVNSLANPTTGCKMLGTYSGNDYVLVDGGAFLIAESEKTAFESDSKVEVNNDGRVAQTLQNFEKAISENAVEVDSVSGFSKGKEKFARVKFSDGSAMTVTRAGFDVLNKAGLTVMASPSAHGMISLKDGVLAGLVLEKNVDPVGDETNIKIRFDAKTDESIPTFNLSNKQYSLSLFGKSKGKTAKAVESETKVETEPETGAAKPEVEAETKVEKGSAAEGATEGTPDGATEHNAVSMTDVIDKIKKDFGKQITLGYMRDLPKDVAGRYDTVDKGVRYRTANDIETVAHELGHALDDQYQILTKDTDLSVLKWYANTLSDERIAAYREAYGLKGDGVDAYLPLAKEGLADRLADYLTDPEKALKEYPKFKPYFINQLSKADRARLERAANMVHEAVTNDDALLRGTVHTIEKPKKTDDIIEGMRQAFKEGTPEERKEYRSSTATYKVDSFITTFFNKNQRLKRLGQLSNSGSCEAFIDAQNATYNTGVVYSALMGNMTDLDGNVVGGGFHEILEGLTDAKGHLDPKLYHEFGLYLDIVHSAERQAQGHKIPQTMEKALENGTVERMEKAHPNFRELSEAVYAYNNRLLDIAVSYGLVDKTVVKGWRDTYERYVPMQRYFDEQTRKSRGEARATMPKGFANINSPYKRAKGSQLDYYNPLDLIIQQTASVYQSAMHNRVMQSIVDLVADSPEPAILMERIPDDLHINKISTDELVERLTKKVKNNAEIEPEVADGMLQLLSDAIPEYLARVETGTHTDASRRIVTVMENGQKVMYKVNDPELFKAIVNLNPTRDTPVVRVISAVSRGVVKMWTSLNPLFSVSNAARDLGTLTSSTLTEFGGEVAAGKGDRHISLKNRAALMGQMYKNIVKSYAQTIKEHKKGLTATDPYHQEYIAMGGNESGLADNAKFMSVDVREQFSKESSKRAFKARHGFRGAVRNGAAMFLYASNMVERGPREAIYITAREMGVEPKLAYRLSQDTTTDFKNGGTLKGVSAFIPLFNAGLAGSYRAGRHWTGEHITSDYKIDPITSKSRQKRAAGRILASVILAISGALLQTVLGKADEDNYTQLSNYTKNNFYCIPVGNGMFATIPKPREWAALQSIFERSAEAVFMDNEYALDGGDTWEYLTDMFLPNGISAIAQGDLMGTLGTIAGVGPLFEVGANKDYLGRDIVPQTLQNLSPEYQYNENTSAFAWALGQAFGVSPLKVDHIGRNLFGGWWEIMKAHTEIGFFQDGDGFLGTAENVIFSTAIGNRLVRDSAYSTDIINRMYDMRDAANIAKNDAVEANGEKDNKAEMEYKWAYNLSSFYSTYNKLAKTEPDSDQKRATRQTVLDMIESSMEAIDGKVTTAAREKLEAYVKRTGDTTVMPGVMVASFTYGNSNTTYELTADQYVEFQTIYNTYYWKYLEEFFANSYSQTMSDSSIKKTLAKKRDRALNNAKRDIVKKIKEGT